MFTHTLAELIPPSHPLKETTLQVENGQTDLTALRARLGLLRRRGLADAGLIIVSSEGWLRGYITQTELEHALNQLAGLPGPTKCSLIAGNGMDGEDISVFVDRTSIMLGKDTPIEVVAEVFGRVGCQYVCIVEDGKGFGVVIKKQFLMFMEEMTKRH